MLEELATGGTKTVILNARGDNAPALALYESLGFARTETSDDGTRIQMMLDLNDA